MEKFSIEFENSTGLFFAGQEIKGHVYVKLTDSLSFRGLRIGIFGAAETHWTETSTATTFDEDGNAHMETTTDDYDDEEIYVNNEVVLWGKHKDETSECKKMPRGAHQFQFSFTLPKSCPNSFSGDWGEIRYLCTATIDKPWKLDETVTKSFNVVPLVDLNKMDGVNIPVNEERTKSVCCWCCKSGVFYCCVNLPRTGFVPGEDIPITIQVLNNSSTKIDDVSVSFKQYVEFNARGSTRRSEYELGKLDKGSVDVAKRPIWNKEKIHVPPVPPTLNGLITIDYRLHFVIDPDGPHFDLSFDVPVIIGNIPLNGSYLDLQKSYKRANCNLANLSTFLTSTFPDLPPPLFRAFNDTRFGSDEIETETDELSKPKYAYFCWSKRNNDMSSIEDPK